MFSSPRPVKSEQRAYGVRSLASWLLSAALCAVVATPSVAQSATPPYPPSDLIRSASWDFDQVIRDASGSDLWPLTWADDDNVYTSWGDGTGFTGPGDVVTSKVSYGFAKIQGVPPSAVGEDVAGFEPLQAHGKIAAIVSIDGVLYVTFNKQDGSHDHSMGYSVDHGRTFVECPTAMWPASGDFFPSGFATFGRDYEGARDGYLYIYGGKWIWDDQVPGNDIYLARTVAPARQNASDICDIARYEYLSGPDADGDGVYDGGEPEWSPDIARRVSVFHDPNGVGNPGLARSQFVRALGRYVLTVPHRAPGQGLVAGVGQLGIFEGPEPWGPWKTVAYYDDWGGFGTDEALGYHLTEKWFSADGRTFWMAFSGGGDYDALYLIRGTFDLDGGNRPPVAVASAQPDSGVAPLSVQFSSSGSYDPDGTLTAYAWDFGDGGTSTEPSPVHVFAEAGTYNVVLTVTDDAEATDSDELTILVVPAEAPPSAPHNLRRTDKRP